MWRSFFLREQNLESFEFCRITTAWSFRNVLCSTFYTLYTLCSIVFTLYSLYCQHEMNTSWKVSTNSNFSVVAFYSVLFKRICHIPKIVQLLDVFFCNIWRQYYKWKLIVVTRKRIIKLTLLLDLFKISVFYKEEVRLTFEFAN